MKKVLLTATSGVLIGLISFSVIAADVDLNTATSAEMEGLKGIGPSLAAKIFDERKKGSFKSWDDVEKRVKGISEKSAASISADGATIAGAHALTMQERASAKAAARAETQAKKDEAARVKAEAKAEKVAAKAARAQAKYK